VNVGSGVLSGTFNGPIVFTGFTTLGEGNTGLKCKRLTGTTGAENASVNVAHGIDSTKIAGYYTTIFHAAGAGVDGVYGIIDTTCKHNVSFDTTNFTIGTISGASTIASKPFSILVWYIA